MKGQVKVGFQNPFSISSFGRQARRTACRQRKWLALISTGNRYAVASRGSIGFAGGWVWRWTDRIDRLFMRRFSDLPGMPREP